MNLVNYSCFTQVGNILSSFDKRAKIAKTGADSKTWKTEKNGCVNYCYKPKTEPDKCLVPAYDFVITGQ